MRLLANENCPGVAVQALRAGGHEVAWVREDSPGCSDANVAARASAEGRLLVTFDKDFGELAYRLGLPPTSGVVLLRIRRPSASHVAEVVTALLAQPGPWEGMFTVVEDDRIRRRPLPSMALAPPERHP